jgi:flagellar assembly protein FliH
MSNIIKLNIKKKKVKAIISDGRSDKNGFTEYSEAVANEGLEKVSKSEVDEAYKKGYEEAQKEVTEKLTQIHEGELLKQSEEFYSIISSFEETINKYHISFNTLVINVSQKIAEKILKRELENKTTIEEILQQSIHKIIGANEVIIKLHSRDFETLNKNDKVKIMTQGMNHIKFEIDDNIEIGGCLIETEIGNLDARISSQLNEISKALENVIIKNETE